MSPPITSVSLSRRCTDVCVSRVAICGTPLRKPHSELTTGCSATLSSPLRVMMGVMSSVTPVWNVCSCEVATVPLPPPIVVRMLIESPARIVAVRPDIVVMRGSASTRALPFWIKRLSCTWKLIGGARDRLEAGERARARRLPDWAWAVFPRRSCRSRS